MTHEINIPNWRPVSLNKLLSVPLRVRMRLKKTDREMVAIYAKIADIPRAQGKRRVSLKIYLQGRQKVSDPDALWKVLLDSLVACGALVDDRAAYCELGTVEFVREGDMQGTTVILEDL